MAVVSISRIQVRRGRKNEGTGLPQLASGEFAWAVDSRELYIGNGSVAEGAPFVGNTQILTENDNILEFASAYRFKATDSKIETGPDVNNPIERSIQERLDEQVTVKSFGAFGNGIDQTVELQRAIDNLFNNPGGIADKKIRMILNLNAGTYLVSDTIELPANCYLQGAGKDRTVIVKNTIGPVFKTVQNDDQVSPSNIRVESIGLELDGAGGFYIEDCSNSIFRDIDIKGTWTLDDAADDDLYGFAFDSTLEVVEKNEFSDISINGQSYGYITNFDAKNNVIKHNNIDTCYTGISFSENITIGASGQLVGPSNNEIINSIFSNISNSAVIIDEGNNNLLDSNKFYSTGYQIVAGVADKRDPVAPVVKFGLNTVGNTSVNNWFERTEEYTIGQSYTSFVPYVPEISGPAIYTNSFQNKINLGQVTQPAILIKLPADVNSSIKINYVYNSILVNAVRKGTLSLTIEPGNNRRSIVDEFEFIGDTNYQENLEFGAVLTDENNDGNIDSLGITVLNLTFNDQAELSYTIDTFR